MDKTIHFVAGLPRSGSTLICNILNQNPRFHATSTSGILDVMLSIRNQWESFVNLKASPNKAGKNAVMVGMLQNYYSTVERPVVFDKSRGWPSHVELAEHILQRKAKIIVPVRKITDILASFEKLWRSQAHEWQFPQEKTNHAQWQTVEGRADVWMNANQPVGSAYNRIRDAIHRGYLDRIQFVEFEELTKHPEFVMREVYEFLEEEWFDHDFNHVPQSTNENDDIHGIPGLHVIRPEVKPFTVDVKAIIGDTAYNKYDDAQFWTRFM